MTYADIADVVDESNVGLKGSPTFVAVSTTKEAKGAGTVLKDLTADEAVSAIVEKLADLHIIQGGRDYVQRCICVLRAAGRQHSEYRL